MTRKKGKDFRYPRTDLDTVRVLKIIDKLVLKFLMSRRVSQKYGLLQLSY